MEEILKSIPELSGVPARDIKTLASVATLVSFKKDEILFRADEKAGFAWFLVSGKAVLGNASQNGNQSATCIVKSGDLFCCIPIMDFGSYTSTAV